MPRRALSPWLWLCVMGLVACEQKPALVQEVVRVPFSTITLPRLDGWMEDPSLKVGDASAGGPILRLVQRSGVAGAPRIDVMLEPKRPTPTNLKEYVRQNLQEMGSLEAAGRLRILRVEQQDVQIDQIPAIRVQHEFTTGHGNAQMSLFQVSLFLVYNGRGVTVTASGRTELFHPQAQAIAYLLQGLRVGTGSRQDAADTPTIDLGRVGGRRP